jgi:hypothetical protein
MVIEAPAEKLQVPSKARRVFFPLLAWIPPEMTEEGIDATTRAKIDALFRESPPPTPLPHHPSGRAEQAGDVPPASPENSGVSTVSVSEIRNGCGKVWKGIRPFTTDLHGGRIVKETDTVIFKVPEKVDRRRYPDTNLFGEPLGSRATVRSFKPLTHVGERATRRRANQMLAIVREKERLGEDLSDTVVRLYLSCIARMAPDEVSHILGKGTRLSGISVLPPFEAFNSPASVRDAVRKPAGDRTRLFPLPTRVHYAYSKATTKAKDLVMPSMQGLDHVADHVDAIESSFTVKSIKTDPAQFFNLSLTAMLVHKFNCHARELIELSGAAEGSDKPLPPIADRFSLGTLKADSFLGKWTGKLSDLVDGHDQESFESFAVELNSTPLPPRDKAIPEFAKLPWCAYSDRNAERLAHAVLAGSDALRRHCASASSASVKKHIGAYLYGYVTWRYYYLPDLVLACCALDYLIMHPRATPRCVYIDCPVDSRNGKEEFSKRVTSAPYTNDPSIHMLFMFFRDSFDAYGASILLYKLVCERKCHILTLKAELRRQRFEAKKNADPPPLKHEREDKDESSSSSSDGEGDPFKLGRKTTRPSVRTFNVIRKKCISVLECLDDIDPSVRVSELPLSKLGEFTRMMVLIKSLTESALNSMNDLYAWKRYPMLCNSFADKRTNVSKRQRDPAGHDQNPGGNRTERQGEPEENVRKGEAKNSSITAPDPEFFDAALYKSLSLGRVVVLLHRERTPVKIKADMECGLKLFDASFKIVGEKAVKALGTHSYRECPRFLQAVELVYDFMKSRKLFADMKSLPELKFMSAFVLANRAECPELLRYRHLCQYVIFRFVEGTELHSWYLESKAKHEEDEKKVAVERAERKRVRDERSAAKRQELEKKRRLLQKEESSSPTSSSSSSLSSPASSEDEEGDDSSSSSADE